MFATPAMYSSEIGLKDAKVVTAKVDVWSLEAERILQITLLVEHFF